MRFIYFIIYYLKRIFCHFEGNALKYALGYCGKNVTFLQPFRCANPGNIYMYDNTVISDGFKFISVTGKFIMKRDSGAAVGLTVITGNHHIIKGKTQTESVSKRLGDIEKDIIVGENVWIGANVTLLDGCCIGRGSIIGSGSVVRNKIPPYSIVIGNPSKIVGFVFKPEEIIEHEKNLYSIEERLPLELLEKNYKKYFIDKVKDIRKFIHI